jgi:hypothetical protein
VRDSLTHEYCRPGLSIRGLEESPPEEGSPMDPSPKDWGLDGEVLGDSAGFGPGEVPVELGLRAASTKGDGAPLALGGGL